MKRLTEEKLNKPDESSCESNASIHHIKEIEKIEDTNKHHIVTVKINAIKKEIIIHTGSPLTTMPIDKRIMKPSEIQKITNRYQNVHKIEVKFRGKVPIEFEYENNKQKTEILITERPDITPFMAMHWMKKFKLTIGKIQLSVNGRSEKEKVFIIFTDLFENNETIKDTETNI